MKIKWYREEVIIIAENNGAVIGYFPDLIIAWLIVRALASITPAGRNAAAD